MIRVFGLLIAAAGFVLSPASVSASGFLLSKIGGDSAGPLSSSPSAIYWNPGALGLVAGTRLYVDNNLLFRSTTFSPADGIPHISSDDEGILRALKSQPMLALTSDFGTRHWVFGLGAYAPFGSSSAWADPHGPQRYQAIHGKIRGIYLTPAVAYRPTKNLSLGVGVSLVSTAVQSYKAVDFGEFVAEFTGATVPSAEPGNEGRMELDFEGLAWTWSAGVVWRVADWRLAGSYSATVDVEMDGRIGIYAPRNQFYTTLLGGDLSEAATFSTTWPRIGRVGVEYEPGRWAMTVTAEWVQWSAYDAVRVDVKNDNVAGLGSLDRVRKNHWRDTVNVRAGSRYQLNDAFAVFGGLGAENSAIPKEHLEANIFDAFKIGGAAGVKWQMTDALELVSSLAYVHFLSTDVSTSGLTPSANGLHRQDVAFLNTNLTWRLPL